MPRIMISLDNDLHHQMKELALRRRRNVGVEYERAIRLYLDRLENYIGMKKEIKNGRKESRTQSSKEN